MSRLGLWGTEQVQDRLGRAGSGEAEPLRTSSTFLTVRGQVHLPAQGPSVITKAHPSLCVHPDPDSLLT